MFQKMTELQEKEDDICLQTTNLTSNSSCLRDGSWYSESESDPYRLSQEIFAEVGFLISNDSRFQMIFTKRVFFSEKKQI